MMKTLSNKEEKMSFGANPKKWIPKDLKKGAFTAWCKSQGFGGVTAACIAKGKKSKNPTTRKRATLAQTFKKMAKKRRK